MFVDEIVVEVYGGAGGNGMTSFRREKYVEYGGPSGGNGGVGGNVVFVGDEGKLTLIDLRYQRHIKAPNGENAKSKGMHGANALHKYVKVPLGTIVYNNKTKEKIGEITFNGQELIVAKGGRGGRGNMAFATHKNPAPRISENGDRGEVLKIKVDLKVLADVGLLGFPSVGKSTFISVVSNARPKIAEYHFTTLSPNLGMVQYKDADFAIADLPGLIENASKGQGLGTRFLKHVERCRVFLHIVDASLDDAFSKFNIINRELENYNPLLSKRKQIIVFNKIDLIDDEKLASLKKEFKDYNTFSISALTKNGINTLLDEIIKELREIPAIVVENDDHVLYELEEEDDFIEVVRKDNIFYVTSPKIELLFNRTNFGEEEAIKRFARQLRTLGLEEVLVENGAQSGDTIDCYGFQFDFLN